MMTYAEEAMNSVMEMLAQAPSENDIEEAMCGVCAFGIAVLRGLRGEEFVQGYLVGAMDDRNAITISRGDVQ